MKELKCEVCNGELIEGKGGYIVCRECGLETDLVIYNDRDSLTFDENGSENKTQQHGDFRRSPLHPIHLATVVDPYKTSDPKLRKALKKDPGDFGYYEWSIRKVEIVTFTIDRLCYNLHLSEDFKDECYLLFKKIMDNHLLDYRDLENVAATVVYLVVRMSDLPYTLFDFEIEGYSKRLIFNYYFRCLKGLMLFKKIKKQSVSKFVIRIFNELVPEESEEDYKERREYLEFLVKLADGIFGVVDNIADLSYGLGIVYAAACIYITSKKLDKYKFTQKQLAKFADTSEVTLRSYVRKIKKEFKAYESQN